MFVDQVKIHLKAGDGGNGCVSFRREKYVPRGGPNGGNGGRGGDIILRADPQLRTLLDLKYQQHYRVGHAEHGRGKDQNGKNTPPLVISVPLGTMVRDADSSDVLADLTRDGETVIVARGGRGGRGNASFATSTNRAPRHAEEGEKGEERQLQLELKLLADVGLVGLPNAGKTTFISRVTRARPKVADYPFTTLTPNLGVVHCEDEREFIVADIPGLIEGAHTGKGLGIRFLKHIERNIFLLYMVDIGASASEEPVRCLEILRNELEAYHSDLVKKPFAVALTKIDSCGDETRLKKMTAYCRDNHYDCFPVSSVTGAGIQELIRYLGRRVAKEALKA